MSRKTCDKGECLRFDLEAKVKSLADDHAENARLLRLVIHDLQGRVEAGKLAALVQCADRAQAASQR